MVKPSYIDLLTDVDDVYGLFTRWSGINDPVAIAAATCNVLHFLRERMHMEVAFVTHFERTMRHFQYVDAEAHFSPVRTGDRRPMDVGYCKKVVDGIIPQFANDTDVVPVLQKIPETRAVPVRSYISVPLAVSDWEVYGTLCCFSRFPQPLVSEWAHQWVRDLAAMIGMWIAAGRLAANPLAYAAWPSFEGQGGHSSDPASQSPQPVTTPLLLAKSSAR